MASSLEYMLYIVEQLSEDETVSYKKMFGEYGLFFEGIYFACICDDRLLVKITEAGKALIPDCKTELPYEGAKPMFFIEEVEDKDLLQQLTRATCTELSLLKTKRRKKGNVDV